MPTDSFPQKNHGGPKQVKILKSQERIEIYIWIGDSADILESLPVKQDSNRHLFKGLYIRTRKCVCVCVYKQMWWYHVQRCMDGWMYICMYMCIYIYIYVYIYLYTHTHRHTHTHTHLYIYIHISIYVYVYLICDKHKMDDI